MLFGFIIYGWYVYQIRDIRNHMYSIDTSQELDRKARNYALKAETSKSSCYYYSMAAKYYAKAGDYMAMIEEKEFDESSNISELSDDSDTDDTPVSDKPEVETEPEVVNETEEMDVEKSSDDDISLNEAIKLAQGKSNSLFNAINQQNAEENPTLKAMNSIMGFVDNPAGGSANDLQQALGGFAESMFGTKIDNIDQLLPPQAFDEAISTLQKLSDTLRKR